MESTSPGEILEVRTRMALDHTLSQKPTTILESVVQDIIYQVIYLKEMLHMMLLEQIWVLIGRCQLVINYRNL